VHTDKNLDIQTSRNLMLRFQKWMICSLIVAFFQAYFYYPWLSTRGPPNPKVELVWDFSKNVQIYIIKLPDYNWLLSSSLCLIPLILHYKTGTTVGYWQEDTSRNSTSICGWLSFQHQVWTLLIHQLPIKVLCVSRPCTFPIIIIGKIWLDLPLITSQYVQILFLMTPLHDLE